MSHASGVAVLDVVLSLSGRRWVPRQGAAEVEEALRRQGIGLIESRLLAARGVTPETAQRALKPRLASELPDPLCLSDMAAAVDAIIEALSHGRRIVILADYDVDGGTSGALLLGWLRSLGAQAGVFVPDRLLDGYGPSPKIVRKIKDQGADLLITVDCGAAAHEALEVAHEIGLDVVVFDHHLMHAAPPPARAVVNPNRPGDTSGLGHLTAAGVVFVALVALERAAKARGLRRDLQEPYDLLSRLDLAALGTICDVAPLTGLNRALVAQGLKVLGRLGNPGLAALAAGSGLKAADSTYAAGWVLGPRLNAGGRVGDSSLAVRLLSTEDPDEAVLIAAELEALNAGRRAIEAGVLEDAAARLAAGEGGALDGPLLMIGHPGWHPGVVGIVAGRLKERFHRPVIIAGSADPDDPVAKGSGRSVSGVNLGAAVAASAAAGVLLAGGGHAMAAGLTTTFADLARVRDDLSARLLANDGPPAGAPDLAVDALIAPDAATAELLDSIARVGPYGAGWPEPVFAMAHLRPASVVQVGQGHVRLTLEDNRGARLRAVAFRMWDEPVGEALRRREAVHVVVRVKRDDWRGGNGVDVEVIDAAIATSAGDRVDAAER